MLKTDSVPSVIIAIDVDDPILNSTSFLGLLQYGDLHEYATIDLTSGTELATTERIRKEKVDPDSNPHMDRRLIGHHLIRLYDDCLAEFVKRIMGDPLTSYVLTSLGVGCPYPVDDLEDDVAAETTVRGWPVALSDFCILFKLATGEPIHDPNVQPVTLIMPDEDEGEFTEFKSDDPHGELADEPAPPPSRNRLH